MRAHRESTAGLPKLNRALLAVTSVLGAVVLLASAGGCYANRTVAGPIGRQPASNDYVLSRTPAEGRGPIEGEARWLQAATLPWNNVSMTPMVFETRKTLFSKDDAFRASKDTLDRGLYERTSWEHDGIDWLSPLEVRWHNVSFDDVQASIGGPSSRLLLNSRGIITAWQVFGPTRDLERKRKYVKQELRPLGIAFYVTQHDHSRDGWLDNRDGRQLLITDHDGANPRFVTPKDASVESAVFNQELQALVISLRLDSNNDGTFDATDSAQQVMVTAPYTDMARPMNAQGARRAAEIIWK
jgi:hypothetical protein